MARTALRSSLLLSIVSLGFVSAMAAENYPTVNYKEAGNHLDEVVWVEGTVLRTEEAPEGVYLLFNANEKYVRILIPKPNIGSFEGSIQHKYTGKRVKAVGKISKYGYKLIVGVSEPKRIKILG